MSDTHESTPLYGSPTQLKDILVTLPQKALIEPLTDAVVEVLTALTTTPLPVKSRRGGRKERSDARADPGYSPTPPLNRPHEPVSYPIPQGRFSGGRRVG